MPRVNIRCCCNVNLLLGTVEAPELRIGDRYTFPLRDGSLLTLEVAQARACTVMAPEMVAHGNFLAKELVERTDLAFKSNDTPLERLRLIPSFIEINQERPLA